MTGAVKPFVSDPDFTLYVGDVRDVLAGLPDGSVDCCVTSPPYWGLRDYGVAGQLGLEETPQEFVDAMVAVFAEVRRVLAPHGTLWLNLGDSYATSPPGNKGNYSSSGLHGAQSEKYRDTLERSVGTKRNTIVGDLKPKDLVGIPWRVAFALQADGWYLRSDIIWSKPNPMPESVTDRPTKAHEYVFLLSKQPRYFFDQEAVREPHTPDGRAVTKVVGGDGSIQHRDGERWPNGGRNVRSVWEIATQPYPDAHFATFPEELPRRCIQAGCPEQVCATCGEPRVRIVEATGGTIGRSWHDHNGDLATGQRAENAAKGGNGYARETTGWSDCGHGNYRTGVVLDPFMGSGTTALVARKHGRRAIGVELNREYAALAAKRLQQLSLLAEPAA